MLPRHRSPFVATYVAFFVAFSLLGLLWFVQSPFSAHAQSQPEALGSISGTVRNTQGAPLPNITVWLEQETTSYPLRSVTSDGQGNYIFHSMSPGTYHLRFEDSQENYAASYYPGAIFAQDAEGIVVSGNNVTGIDMELSVGGTLAVTIENAAGPDSVSASLTLYRQSAAGHWLVYRTAYIDPIQPEGPITALPSGVYRLCAQSYLPSFFTFETTLECYDNLIPDHFRHLPSNATDIEVQSGTETALTMVLNDLVQVEGYVHGPNDEPLADIPVVARTPEWFSERLVITDAQGYFRFGYFRKGTYRLLFNSSFYFYPPGDESFLPRYYPPSSATPGADYLTIGPDTKINITLELTPSAQITGNVTFPNNVPLDSAYITAYRQLPDGSWRSPDECLELCPASSYDFNTGEFILPQLEAGRYRVRAQYYAPGTLNIQTVFYGGTSLEDATDITLEAGETVSNVNILIGDENFEATIAGVVSADDTPLEGIEVGLFYQYPAYEEPDKPIVYTVTDEDGRYRLEGLAAGTYRVGVRDPDGIYATTFYIDSEALTAPDWLTVENGETLSGIDIALSPGGTIRGHIRTAIGKHPGDFEIILLHADSIYPLYLLSYVSGRTDADGAYEIAGVPPGSYLVQATSPEGSADYETRLVRFYPGRFEPFFGEEVQVQAEQTIEGVDIYFGPIPSSYLPIIGSD